MATIKGKTKNKAVEKPAKKKVAEKPTKDKKKLLSRGSSKPVKSGKSEGLVSKGYGAVKEQEKRNAEARELAGKKVFRTWLPDGKPVTYLFHNDEPLVFWEHRVQFPNMKRPEFYVCIGDDCPLCKVANGRAISKARQVGAYLVTEVGEYTIQSGPNKGKTIKDALRLFVEGQTTLSQLEIFSTKFKKKGGLVGRSFEITRKERNRTIIPGDPEPIPKHVKKGLRELLEAHEVDSIDELLQEQIDLITLTAEDLAEKFDVEDLEEDDEEEESLSKRKNKKLRKF